MSASEPFTVSDEQAYLEVKVIARDGTVGQASLDLWEWYSALLDLHGRTVDKANGTFDRKAWYEGILSMMEGANLPRTACKGADDLARKIFACVDELVTSAPKAAGAEQGPGSPSTTAPAP